MALFGPSKRTLREQKMLASMETQQVSLETQQKQLSDLRVALATEKRRQRTFEQEVKQRRRTLQKPLQYATSNVDTSGFRRGKAHQFYGPLHDLGEIARAIDIEPFISISVRKHREQILKEGWNIEGAEDEMIEYINRRLFEMYLVSGVTTEQWVREFTTQLVTFATAFLVLRRNINKSSGNIIKIHGKKLDPIAAVFPMDPTSVKVELNKHGHPKKWMQRVDNTVNKKSRIEFDTSDIILATIDKKSGFVFGTPYILPVLDDVRALRRIEEISEVLAQAHAYPITHWMVGEKDDPAEEYDDGSTEIDVVRAEVANMPTEGGIVTSHRVASDMMGAANKVLDLVPYLEYFEARVMGGLRISPEDIGRSGGAKASAVTVSQSLQDSSKDFQGVIGDSITHGLFLPLLLEGEFNVTKDNLVHFIFPLINREENRAQEAHATDQFNSGVITRTELRRDNLNMKELSEEECKDCLPDMNQKRELELARVTAAAKAAASPTPGAKTTANKSRPKNQSGRKPTKTRVKANDIHKEFYFNIVDVCFKDNRILLRDFIERHGDGVNSEDGDQFDLTTKDEELKSILQSFVTLTTIEARRILSSIIMDGSCACMRDLEILGEYTIPKRTIDRFFKNTVEKSYKRYINNIYENITNNEIIAGLTDDDSHPLVALSAICDLAADELNSITSKHIDISYRFGYSRAAKAHDCSIIILTPEDPESEGDPITVSLKLKDIPYSTLLATPGSEDYSISLVKKNLGAE